MLARIMLIFIAVATASTPVLARSWHHHHHHHVYGWYGRGYGGDYNYGGPHYSASDYYHNSRQLTGTR